MNKVVPPSARHPALLAGNTLLFRQVDYSRLGIAMMLNVGTLAFSFVALSSIGASSSFCLRRASRGQIELKTSWAV